MVDVLVCNHPRVCVCLDRVILSRQAECVETDRVQNVVALHPPLSGDNLDAGICLDVADVHAGAGRVRELDKAVELWLFIKILRLEDPGVLPLFLPLGLDLFYIVFHKRTPPLRRSGRGMMQVYFRVLSI